LIRRLAAPLSLAALSLLILPDRVFAGEKDTDAVVAIAEAMNDFVDAKYADALKKLEATLKDCAKVCEPATRAQLQFHIGVVYGLGQKNIDKARIAFDSALRENPKLVPDRQFMNKELDKLFTEVKTNIKKGGPPPPPKSGPTKEQMDAVASAQGQLAQKDWSGCMGTLIAVMAEAEFAAGKLLLARCQDTGGLILEATADAKLAAALAEEEGNADLGQQAKELIERLDSDTPTITLVIPKAVDKPTVTIDGVEVPADKIREPIPHNPGKATIEVKGKRGPYPYAFKATETIDRGEKITVQAEQGDQNTSAVQQCINAARSAADLQVCIETGGKGRGLTFRGSLEVASYNDTFHVDVVAPAIALSLENPTSGWRIGGSFLVDVVTAASPDIVATASRRFDQSRFGGTLSGEYKIGPAKVGVDGGISAENDYLARSVGVSGSADLFDKRVTPTLAYGIGFDTLGRADTPYDVFSRDLMRHTIDAGVSVVLDPSTVVVGGATAQFELGDSSKPYRYVPMFTGDVAPRLPRGAVPSLVGASRAPVMPLEQLPDARSRFALFGRFSRRFETVTIRGDERVYIDSWGLKASTTDARLFWDATKTLRVGPHARFHIQSPVGFWERAYSAALTPTGWQMPKYRTGDRELGPLFGVTVGGGVRYQLSEIFAASVQVEGIYTQFLDHVYVYDRLGLFTATTIEMEVE
jgi:hypothetical protein